MSADLAELERHAGAILGRLGPAERRQLLRRVARDLKGSQAARIAAQRNADGSPYAPRKSKPAPKKGGYPIKFLYPKGAARPRLVLMRDWIRQGDHFTGFDIESGAERTYAWDKVARWLPVEPADRARPGGTLRRRGGIRRQAMFRKLRQARYLKSGATDAELWVGFSGRAAAIARVHQEGGEDRPAPKAKPVRYPRRQLLGLTEADRDTMINTMLSHLVG
ncbi:phage virion morphogenesis protein [Sphingomonas morindae]|uniref:Phage virion morphogenesis protein n=1 Tax=Sphingomonas morindae TaxID=1541170 RepID=A0ABY4X734_9SPHN|nr:phage virion morphogenesis protein [Sphingomonas morindae]USI72715.1 phage virion morphogenesis protein [Sphingomonas morindae]